MGAAQRGGAVCGGRICALALLLCPLLARADVLANDPALTDEAARLPAAEEVAVASQPPVLPVATDDGNAALAQSLAARHWRLVLASVYTPEAAERETARLLSKGLEVVTEIAQANEKQVYRLTFGAFETRDEAQHALDDQRHRPGFERAWVLLRP